MTDRVDVSRADGVIESGAAREDGAEEVQVSHRESQTGTGPEQVPVSRPDFDRILGRDPLAYPDRIADLVPSALADDGFAVVVHSHQVT